MRYTILDVKENNYVYSGNLERCNKFLEDMDILSKKTGVKTSYQIEELGKPRKFVKIEREKIIEYIRSLEADGYESVTAVSNYSLCKTDGIHFDYVDIEYD